MSTLSLNEHHEKCIVNYMRFSRYQKGSRLKSIRTSFNEIKSTRLVDETFSYEEVSELLDALLENVLSDVDAEMDHSSHTNVLLLMQVFQQAQKWHLKLQPDISELENRDLLEQIKKFEECEMSGRSQEMPINFNSRLEPINNTGATQLLNQEIERLNVENKKLKERMKQIENQAVNGQKEKNNFKQELEEAQKQLSLLSSSKPQVIQDEKKIDELNAEIVQMKLELERTLSSNCENEEMVNKDLSEAKHEFLKIQYKLESAEKELEKKVSETNPFQNLKSMIQKKNEQIKQLRSKLSKYENVVDE